MIKEKELVKKEDWYNNLLEDLKKLAWTRLVELKHTIGKRILQEELKFGKPEYGSKRIENLAKDLKASTRDLYYCIQFAKQYPEIATMLQNSSWRYVVNNLLPEPRKQQAKIQPLPKGKYNIIYADYLQYSLGYATI